tara:strand:- start:1412 stop:1591 length:180 start_codon:yes stop_codon:yes gene_type:complete
MNLEEYLVSKKKNIPKQVKKLIEIQNNEFNNILNELIYFNKKISHLGMVGFSYRNNGKS